MSELKICRICLRTEAKVYNYEQYQLKAYYEEVLAMKVTEKDDLPHYFCFECATLLHKFHKFKEKCYSGQKVLKEMLIKGPAGILEQLKLRQEASFNMEISSPLCTNSTSQEIEVCDNPFLNTDIDITKLPIVTDGYTSNDPTEIDSFFINNLNVVIQDERMIENTNICSKTLDNIKPFQNHTLKVDSNLSQSNNINFSGDTFIENEPSPIVICGLRSVNETALESDPSYTEMNSNPTENLVDINKASTALYCDLSGVSQVFDESNLRYIESNMILDSQKDFNMESVTENESSSIIHLPSTSRDLFKTCLEYEENNQQKNFEQIELSTNTEEQPSTIYLSSLDTQMTNLNSELDIQNNIDGIVFASNMENTAPQHRNENHLDQRVRITSKNQLAPNIHGVALPTTSEQYFDALDDLNIENAESEDSLNQLNVEQPCTTFDANVLIKNKRLRERIKNLANKQVKPIPCHKKCHNNCSLKVTEVDRQVIHERYWKMDKQEQQELLLSCIKPKNIRRRQGSTTIKNITYDYFILVGDKNIKVCQQFLMKTLDVSQMRFRYAIAKLKAIDSKNEDRSSDSDTDSSY